MHINGSNFGAPGRGYLSGTLGSVTLRSATGQVVARPCMSQCDASVADTQIRCLSPAWYGQNYNLVVQVAKQFSPQAPFLLSYGLPVVFSASLSQVQTVGQETLVRFSGVVGALAPVSRSAVRRPRLCVPPVRPRFIAPKGTE